MAVLQRSDFGGVFLLSGTVDIASGGTDSATDTTVTHADIKATDIIIAVPPATFNAGLVAQTVHTVVAGGFTLRTTNASAGTVDPASATWQFIVFRR